MLAAVRDARPGGEWLRALAAAAHELAEEAHAGQEPVDGRSQGRGAGEAVPFAPLELRAAAAAAATLTDLAALDGVPGSAAPAPAEALELLEDVRCRCGAAPPREGSGC